MRRAVHVAFSTLVALSLILPYGLSRGYRALLDPPLILLLVMLYYGSILPDVDAGSRGSLVLRVTSIAIYLPVKTVSRMLGGTAGRHRGFMHTFTGLAITTAFWFAVFAAPCILLEEYASNNTWICRLFMPRILGGLNVPRAYVPASTVSVGVASGYLLHLLGDSYTRMGIKVLFRLRLRGRLKNGVNDHYPILIYGSMAAVTYLVLWGDPVRIGMILVAELFLMSLTIWVTGRS